MGKKTPSQSLENAVRGPTKQSNTEQFWDTFQLLDVFMGKSIVFDTKSLSQPLKESLALFTHSLTIATNVDDPIRPAHAHLSQCATTHLIVTESTLCQLNISFLP